MDIESTQLILAKLDVLAAKLGVTADAVWPWFITHVYMKACVPILLCACFCIAAFLIYKPHKKSLEKYKGYDDFGCETGFFWLLFSIATFCFVLIITVSLMRFINPEYYALQSLIGMIK